MVINPTIHYALYELGTNLWKKRNVKFDAARVASQGLSSGEIFVLASLAKLGATLVTYPLLVVKNRTQVCYPCQPR